MCALYIDQFFQKGGVTEALNERELFNAVSGLNITADNEVDFQAEVQLSLTITILILLATVAIIIP